MQNIEIRYSDFCDLRVASANSRTIEGYAIVFNSRSHLLQNSFYEEILPEACTQEFIDSQDVRVIYNHIESSVSLARSKFGHGTLSLTVDEKGVKMRFEMPKTPFGEEILDGIRRGDIDKMSFAFASDHDEWEELEDGTYLRTIHGISLLTHVAVLDVTPAYEDTSVANRSLANFKDNIDMSKRNKRTEEELEEEKKSKRADEETQEEEKKSKREDDEKEEDREDDEKEEQEEKSSKRSDEDPDEDEEREDEDEDREDDEEDDERSLKSYYRELEKTLDF